MRVGGDEGEKDWGDTSISEVAPGAKAGPNDGGSFDAAAAAAAAAASGGGDGGGVISGIEVKFPTPHKRKMAKNRHLNLHMFFEFLLSLAKRR